MAFNDLMSDALIQHDISLLRFDAKLRRQVLGQLRTMQEGIISQLANVDFSNVAKQQRLTSMLTQVDSLVKRSYGTVNKAMLNEMQDLAILEQSFQTAKMNDLFKVDIISGGLTPQALRAVAKNSNIFGAPAQEWWGRQSAAMRKRFSDQMKQGFLLGESTGDLIRRVRGSATGARKLVEIGGVTKSVAAFSGGIMDVTTREAEALVRTSVQSVANEVRLATYMNNTDVIGTIMVQVTLDSRTSDICQAHGNRPDEWTLPDFEPVGSSNVFIGPPPYHFNCRTSLLPVTKSWEELQKQGNARVATRQQRRIARKLDNNAPKRTRVSMDGQVPRKTGYGDWLRGQPKTVQLEVLGPTKRTLWKQGKLNLTQTIDQTGRPLTLHQIGKLPSNKAIPLKLPPRQPPVALPKISPSAPPSAVGFIAPPKGIRTVTLAELRDLTIGAEYKLNGDVFKVITKTNTGLESVKWSTRTGKFVTPRNRTKITFGPKPPVPPPPVKPPVSVGPRPPPAIFVDPANYRTLKVGDLFKDAEGLTWKVGAVSNRGAKAVPWSVKSGRFLSLRNGKVFGFTSAPAKLFASVTGSAKELLKKVFVNTHGTLKLEALTPMLQTALDQAISRMSKNGFSPSLAKYMNNPKRNVPVFNMGRVGDTKNWIGGKEPGRLNGMYYSNSRIIGLATGGSRPVTTWIHEFGHHIDMRIVATTHFDGLSIKMAEKLSRLKVAHVAMLKEYRTVSAAISKELGFRGRLITPGQQRNNWGAIERSLGGRAQSSYSLHNEFEWVAEGHAHYYNAGGSRAFMMTQQPATYNFFAMLNSSDLDDLWKALGDLGS